MKAGFLLTLGFLCLALGSPWAPAWAADGQPGSCLIYPYFNSHPGQMTIFRISNVSMETVYVRLVFIDEVHCAPEDRWISLTGGDTLTFLDTWMIPVSARGFLYAHIVESGFSSAEKESNVLIGQELVFGSFDPPFGMGFSINALAFKALDVVPDGKIHLDGVEYEPAPKTVYFPGFFGQEYPDAQNPIFDSKLILINLTGGQYFTHVADLLVYNDDEQAFSAQYSFPCFAFVDLVQVSAATKNSFLLSTLHDPDEPGGFSGLGLETGWISITGNYAFNPSTSFVIDHASLLAVMVERMGGLGYGVDLPLHLEDPATHKNGMLWSTSQTGN
jgi:hypothetical protein